jgi:ribosomal protein L19E
MMNNLSPLHESRIIPEMDRESIRLISNPMQSYNDSGISEISSIRKAKKKSKGRGKGKGKGRGKTVNKKRGK